ncbi:hypothetical protein MLD38_034797 [Melastoma candidum]|uniref:Uncharacterized protein n=1 Tax=Melastoma candidum TaxID=119954 RepID=A0ACB9MDI1_9MYRT|nr:hypothetical protein MLD38_034797 [Melastoma candidum]
MLDKLDAEELVAEEEEDEEGLGGRVEKKRRLSVDQVKSLEKSFEKENRLEPERKSRLAEELGLQPKQVAIWFQNRRARWKTKRLERDYGALKSDYDSLKADYDCLDHENKSLLSQLGELKMKLQQQNRAAEDNRDDEHRVVAMDECPISEPVTKKPKIGYGSEIETSSGSNDSLIKDGEEKEDSGLNNNLLKVEMDAIMPMSSKTSGCSLNHKNNSTSSSGSWRKKSISSWYQAVHAHPHQGEEEQQQQHVWLNFFLVDQAPTLHCDFAAED